MLPTVRCQFHNTVPLGIDQAVLLAALQLYIDQHVGPAWGVGCQLLAGDPQPGEWPLHFLDDADQAGALGYHDDPAGVPEGFVFVRTSVADGEPVSVTASHELAELLVDPGANLAALSPRGRFVALEIADPVESDRYTVTAPGGTALVSNFVLPAWFGGSNPPGLRGFDHLGLLKQAWELDPGGYIPVWSNGQWSNLFGSGVQLRRYQRQNNHLRRSDRRRWRATSLGDTEGLVACCGV